MEAYLKEIFEKKVGIMNPFLISFSLSLQSQSVTTVSKPVKLKLLMVKIDGIFFTLRKISGSSWSVDVKFSLI